MPEEGCATVIGNNSEFSCSSKIDASFAASNPAVSELDRLRCVDFPRVPAPAPQRFRLRVDQLRKHRGVKKGFLGV